MMKITVILCTFNRCQVLGATLESIANSILLPSVDWEILVVDNNSSDQTSEVVKGMSNRFPDRVRYAFEPQSGKSFALNTGIREARGDVLAFVDDDVIVEPTWLQNLTSELKGEKWAGTGGRTLPAEEVPLPRWLALRGPYALGGILAAMFDLGDEPCELDRAPYGANMAFRKQIFERYGGFRHDLGPSPNRDIPRPNEDTEFGRRLMAAGECLRYEPGAVAHHPISADRINEGYFLSWWFDYGRASIREGGRKPNILKIQRHWLTIPKLIVAALLPSAWKWVFALNPQRRFYSKCLVWRTLGQIRELRQLYYRGARSKVG